MAKNPNGKTLADFEDLVSQIHRTKNDNIDTKSISYGSNLKIWWICPVSSDHEWCTAVYSRTIYGQGCPVCSGKKVVLSNCLATLRPDSINLWHPTKNGNLTPYDFTIKSGFKAWFKCKIANDHEWESRISDFSNGHGCPCCSSHKIVLSNCLATLKPNIAALWHPTKNGDLTPFDVSANSHTKVWWLCSVSPDHEWQVTVNARSNRDCGCPFCSGNKVALSTCVATLRPDIATTWHPTKNGKLTPFDITIGSPKTIWFKCPIANDHEWCTSMCNRSRYGCPMCAGQKIVLSNCLATLRPDVASTWHPTKNGDLTPFKVTLNSNYKVWWICPQKSYHDWEAMIPGRVEGHGCPWCCNSKGEEKIVKTLNELKISYSPQYRFENCKNKKSLPFDFAIKNNGKIVALIEYNGLQHYEPVNFSRSRDSIKCFEDTKRRDTIKFEWCKKQNIPLLIIPHWEFDNIENIISNFMCNLQIH